MKKQDFFDKEERKVLEISKFTDFDHDNESDADACGIDSKDSSFYERNNRFFDDLQETFNGETNNGNPVSITCELLEKNFSSREISFLLSKSIITESLLTKKKEQ
tara:strand:- start:204 stop:518 length:315 start_codon:yes stop_codon:yes gene_type:complete